jgi:aurora kinase
MVKLDPQDLFFSTHTITLSESSKRKTIGIGGGGKVDLIYHKSNPSKLFAMKIITILENGETFRIRDEVKLHRSMDHPNIIKIYGSELVEDKIYIFLEYASKGDLYRNLHNVSLPPLSLRNKLKIFIQCVQGIQYMHSKGIIHRDLKLENILLTENLDARLCDFGWAIKEDHPKRRKSMCGTIEYMAPEIFEKNSQTSKVDIWALGK